MKKLSEYLFLCKFFFEEPDKYDTNLSRKKEMLNHVLATLKDLKDWKGVIIGKAMQKLALDIAIKNSEFFMTIRVAITGKKISPPLNESMEILGKEKVLARLKKLV